MKTADWGRLGSFAAAIYLLAPLAGCDAVTDIGRGSAPVGVLVSATGGTEFSKIHECRNEQLDAYAIFSGDSGYSAERIAGEWVSDNPGILAVSNGDLVSAQGFTWPAGTIIARAPGTAVITAKYLDFTSSLTIQVLPVRSLNITPELTDIAEDLPQAFTLEVSFDDGEPATDFSSAADWRLNGVTSAAYLDAGSSTVVANSASSIPVTLIAELPECGLRVTQDLRVSRIREVQLDYEMGATGSLPVGVSEAVSAWATFDSPGSTRQNLTRQIDVDNALEDFVSVNQTDEHLYVEGLDEARQTFVTLSLPDGRWSVQTKFVDYEESDLLSVQVQPQQLTLTYPEEGQLQAIGTFANGQTLPITRHVTWSSDSSVLTVSNAETTAGLVLAARIDQDVEVTATSSVAEEQSNDSATVKIYVPR